MSILISLYFHKMGYFHIKFLKQFSLRKTSRCFAYFRAFWYTYEALWRNTQVVEGGGFENR